MTHSKYGLTREQRMKHAEDAINSGLTQEEFAKKIGIATSAVHYWIKQYRVLHNIPSPSRGTPPPSKNKNNFVMSSQPKKQEPRQELVADELVHARGEVMALRSVNEELMEKLEDANLKVRSLLNVVINLGHQIGDE